ncbi:hypothetical protein L3Q82_003243 [Scortum barcoo]|uniref:Uncharacterized protein n=1 Tax=Scortum barcoo TaxID=214431 RepID=A0ACB8VTJ3_9TELE|nr:hypothetical protein L3Q82_003243 [Scortum barcoo]
MLAADSRWNPTAITDAFISGLDEGIKDQLAPHATSNNFEDLADRIDNSLQEREAECRRSIRRSSKSQGVPWDYGEFHRSSSAPAHEEPMQLSCTKLAPKERQRHLKEGA